ncbi:hypothetical protein O3P69_006629, partial [Scylla paramamosain]
MPASQSATSSSHRCSPARDLFIFSCECVIGKPNSDNMRPCPSLPLPRPAPAPPLCRLPVLQDKVLHDAEVNYLPAMAAGQGRLKVPPRFQSYLIGVIEAPGCVPVHLPVT